MLRLNVHHFGGRRGVDVILAPRGRSRNGCRTFNEADASERFYDDKKRVE
jgi:hypothetical protein